MIKRIFLTLSFLILLSNITFLFSADLKKWSHYYHQKQPVFLHPDSYLLLLLLQKIDSEFYAANILSPRTDLLTISPFRRIYNREDYAKDLVMKPLPQPPVGEYFNSSYSVNPKYQKYLEEPWDDLILKALYSDLLGFTDRDFYLIYSLRSNTGDYTDTHVLLALLLVKENQGYKKQRLETGITKIVKTLLKKQKNQPDNIDLFAERIVFLYWAGYGHKIKPEWIDRIKKMQNPDQGWGDDGSDAHATGLALLSIAYFEEGKRKQFFY
ncbi:MAG: DUF4735 domain-containing protein [Spirochaetes bacterium]|nr:DUF4735 domain-containing protein [Spirochaetota bacterium]